MNIEEVKNTPINELFKKFGSSNKGLSDSEATNRLNKHGYNEIPEKKVNPIVKFLRYFWGPIPWMIEAALILSLIISHWEDFWIIMALLLLNAIIGFWQEKKADNAIELLKENLAIKAKVLRDGKWFQILSRELVIGDVVRVRLGDIVPADIKLIESGYLLMDESALTGESLPIEKHSSEVSYSGSIVRQGEMNGLVIATGVDSYFGRTAQLVEKVETKSHFQKAIIKIGDYLIALAIALAASIFLVALFREESLIEIIRFTLVLTVAAIPVALPAVLSVTMAIGATALAKKEAIVSKLVAIEEMAGIDILCADKTGTITKNELTIGKVIAFKTFTEDDVLIFASLASREEDKDPIDDAIIAKTKHMKTIAEHQNRYEIIDFKPFDPVSKRAGATVKDNKSRSFSVSKGAPQAILSLANDKRARTNDVLKDKVEKSVDELASKGYRALGVAVTDGQEKWQYAGIIGLYDPPREDSADIINVAESMGVKVKMVTGDNLSIAKEVSSEVNLGTDIILPSSFLDKPDREARRIVEKADGFAQVFPEHKYHIVELLQDSGHIVGMTGDGVNDAPALKKADAGVAVSSATDAAKSAADIVLTKPGLSVIIDAIKESRKIFQRMNNYSIYRIAETIRVLFFITLSIIVFRFYPVTALMIVLLALLNDAPIMTIAYDNVKYSNDPEKWNMRIILGLATFLGIIGVASSFGILYIGQEILHLNPDVMQSFIYLKLSVAGHLTIFVARTRGPFWSVKPAIPLFMAVIITQLVATIITSYGILLPAMGLKLALAVWAYALVMFLITDFLKTHVGNLLVHRDIIFSR
ncbi:plasma-membrane proton-efflux P-type ATPase [[Eubacterium] cellulosolvens]